MFVNVSHFEQADAQTQIVVISENKSELVRVFSSGATISKAKLQKSIFLPTLNIYLILQFNIMEKIEMFDINEEIAEMVLNNHFLLLVLERFGIKLGLQEKTVKDICAENNINTNVFLAICNLQKNPNKIPELTIQIEDIGVILNYLKNTHEYYIEEVLPKISEQIKLIVENNKDFTFILIERFFEEYKQEVLKHLEYEETIVYPYSMELVSGNNKTIDYKINDYKNHHQNIETKLLDLKNLLIKHLPEKNDQVFRRNLLFELFRFERDLRIHTIIEESILVKAIENLENNMS